MTGPMSKILWKAFYFQLASRSIVIFYQFGNLMLHNLGSSHCYLWKTRVCPSGAINSNQSIWGVLCCIHWILPGCRCSRTQNLHTTTVHWINDFDTHVAVRASCLFNWGRRFQCFRRLSCNFLFRVHGSPRPMQDGPWDNLERMLICSTGSMKCQYAGACSMLSRTQWDY